MGIVPKSGSTAGSAPPANRTDGTPSINKQVAAAKLVYVKLGDALLHVREFRGRGVEERRNARCPACAARVTIRLGGRRAWHAAHRSGAGSSCAAATGEGALHLNAKLALADVLRALGRARGPDGSPLEIALACADDPECRVPSLRPWIVGWDNVVVECRVDAHRPDLVLQRGGTPLAAVEVLVTHAVGEEKAAALSRRGLPWVEVRAASVWAGDQLRWRGDTPMPVLRASRDLGMWRCPRHEAIRLLEAARAEYRALRNANTPEAQTLIDRGQALREMEEETGRIARQIEQLQAAIDLEERSIRAQLAAMPERLRAAEKRLVRAREDYATAERAAQSRMAEVAKRHPRAEHDARRLAELDEETERVEALRRGLSGVGDPSVRDRVLHSSLPDADVSARQPILFLPVDFYRDRDSCGRPVSTRAVFQIDRVARAGTLPELWLVEDVWQRVGRVREGEPGGVELLKAALERRLQEWRRRGVLVDHSAWVALAPGEDVPSDAWKQGAGAYRRALEWDGTERRWALPPGRVSPT